MKVIKEWIPTKNKFYDVYVVSLQCCHNLERVRQLIHAHLGGTKKYTMWQHFLGKKSANFPGFLALLVFAKVSLAESGYFRLSNVDGHFKREVHRGDRYFFGKNQRTSGRGAVMMPFTWKHTLVAFVNVRLATEEATAKDSRLEDLIYILKKTGLENNHKIHHIFLMGDFSDRATLPPSSTSTLLSKTRRVSTNFPVAKSKTMVSIRRESSARGKGVHGTELKDLGSTEENSLYDAVSGGVFGVLWMLII